MEVSIEGVTCGLRLNEISTTSKWVIIKDDFHHHPVKILVGITHRNLRRNGTIAYESIRSAHIIITTDFSLREFSVIKNRYNPCIPPAHNVDYFLNTHLNNVIRSIGYTNIYEIELIKHSIIGALSMITGELIVLDQGKYKTMRDLHIEKNLIKYKSLKHNFIDARVSRS